jgi:hypothetical protein
MAITMKVTPRQVFATARAIMARPFAWGSADCMTSACAVFHALHGIDPLASFQQTYSTLGEAMRILRDAGGYASWCRHTFDLPQTDSPDTGDLVLIRAGRPWGAALVICIVPGEYAGKAGTGVAVLRGEMKEAWTCPSY